jgi:hypothetical protein
VKGKPVVRVNDPSDLCVTRRKATERTSLGTVRVDDVEPSSTTESLEVSEGRPVVYEGDLTAQVLLDHHLKPRVLRFLYEPVTTSDDEHDFVTGGVQSQRST